VSALTRAAPLACALAPRSQAARYAAAHLHEALLASPSFAADLPAALVAAFLATDEQARFLCSESRSLLSALRLARRSPPRQRATAARDGSRAAGLARRWRPRRDAQS
jgi:hypothetical protein